MRGQAGLISTMIMVGVVLIIGLATLAYFNSNIAVQRAELQFQSMLTVESARTITSIVYGNGTDFVIFLSKKMTSATLDILVLGGSSDKAVYEYLDLGLHYSLYYADPTTGVPYYNITNLDGWTEIQPLIKSARQVYVRDESGSSPYIRLSDYCTNLPATGAVNLGRILVKPNEPMLIRVHLVNGLTIDTAWVMILMEVSDSSYQIVAIPLHYSG